MENHETTPLSEEKEIEKKVIPKKQKITNVPFIIISSVIVFVCLVGILGASNYKFKFDNKFMNGLMWALPFPAAIVDGDMVKYYDWQVETKAVSNFSEKKLGDVDQSQIEKDVLNKLIDQAVLVKLAKKYKIKVTDEDIQTRTQEIIDEIGGQEQFNKSVEDFFAWSVEEFKNRVVYPEVLGLKLETELGNSKEALSVAEDEANDVLKLLKKEKISFEDAAMQYSSDSVSAEAGGNLGLFPRGVMVKEFEEAAFSLPVGQLSELVQTDYGFHILVVDEHIQADEENNIEEQVQVKHILIQPVDFYEALQLYKNKAKVYKFVALDE